MASWEEDRDAYKRLRARGLHPRNVAGCADLETANPTRERLTWGARLSDEEIEEQKAAMAVAAEVFGA